jgi:hypothetical protein
MRAATQRSIERACEKHHGGSKQLTYCVAYLPDADMTVDPQPWAVVDLRNQIVRRYSRKSSAARAARKLNADDARLDAALQPFKTLSTSRIIPFPQRKEMTTNERF